MTKLPTLSGKRMLDLLMLCGFEIRRIESSHYFMRHPDGRTTVVPVYRNVDIHRPLLRRILAQAGIEHEDYLQLLRKV